MLNARMRLMLAILVAFPVLARAVRADAGPLAGFSLPDRWQGRFWSEPAATRLLELDPKGIAALVPKQAGFRYCRCPKCGAGEVDDPLSWSIARPESLTCRRCSAVLPDDKVPAKVGDKVPEEVVEVLPRTFHRYPYHVTEEERRAYPDERIYLAAKRDFAAREYLAKVALYAAVKARDLAPGEARDRHARLACALILRFAQVYPAYATHFDRPGQPKTLDRADLGPPYRRLYGTAKWDASGNLDVPLNLLIAYAILREDPVLGDVGRALGDPRPGATIERDLFRASAAFVRAQPEEASEEALAAYRGMLAVGRTLDDPALVREAAARVDAFLARGFYHDGLWRGGDAEAHRRVVRSLDGWLLRLLPDASDRVDTRPVIALAREAARASWGTNGGEPADAQLASWPAPSPASEPRRPALLGGAGIARLGVGRGDDALDLELRGLGDYAGPPSGRLALRVAVAGRPVLGDLDGRPPTPWGFEHASASKSGLVIVDGLNQREAIDSQHEAAPGADLLFFAADADLQVARMADRFAYPGSSRLYRHTLVAASGAKSRYAVSLFEVDGGLQHDQVWHGSGEAASAAWVPSVPTSRGPDSLLPSGIPFVPSARPEDGRWFVQAMGGFRDLASADLRRPAHATLSGADGFGIRVHLLQQQDVTATVGRSTAASAEGRAALVVRRRSPDGTALKTTFVTLMEPLGTTPPIRRAGRVASPDGVVTLAVETVEGTEYLVVNATPSDTVSAALPDGRVVRTDGLAVRIRPDGLTLAGGTFAEDGRRRASLERLTGTVMAAGRSDRPGARGVFRLSDPLPSADGLAGRTLLIRHGDGTSRGWTIASAENLEDGGARLHVRESAGLRIDPETGIARYESFPGTSVPGPHRFGISRIARSVEGARNGSGTK